MHPIMRLSVAFCDISLRLWFLLEKVRSGVPVTYQQLIRNVHFIFKDNFHMCRITMCTGDQSRRGNMDHLTSSILWIIVVSLLVEATDSWNLLVCSYGLIKHQSKIYRHQIKGISLYHLWYTYVIHHQYCIDKNYSL